MDELIILALRGRASPAQLEELAAWRRASTAHERRFRELSALRRILDLHQEIDATTRAPSARALMQATNEKEKRRRARVWYAAAAATFLVGILIGRSSSPQPLTDETVETEFRTGSGDLATAALQDGTVMRLAPDTRVRVSVSPGRRDVWIEGRAFFAVARDTIRPFRVRAADAVATVIGTRFEVDTRENGLRLLVIDGRVNLSAAEGGLELEAGELGSAAGGAAPTVTRVAQPESLLGWMGGFLAFESTPLWKVAREIEARLGVRVRIGDPKIAGRTVTAWFEEEEREEVLRIICRTADVTCERTGDLVVMEP